MKSANTVPHAQDEKGAKRLAEMIRKSVNEKIRKETTFLSYLCVLGVRYPLNHSSLNLAAHGPSILPTTWNPDAPTKDPVGQRT